MGTTWLGLSAAEGELAFMHRFPGDRRENKSLAADAALSMLMDYLTGREA